MTKLLKNSLILLLGIAATAVIVLLFIDVGRSPAQQRPLQITSPADGTVEHQPELGKGVVIKDSVKLCETENPKFNPTKECQKIISKKYSNKNCVFKLGPTEWVPTGSCRDCIIECQ